nr:tRNA lysidine(34) synthetase TilS C-terminal domain-containing protein [Segatella maculosa]
MKGSKLVNDLLTDLKLSLDEKQRQLVVVDAADKIIWVVGRRIDDSVSVTSETTEILRLQVL